MNCHSVTCKHLAQKQRTSSQNRALHLWFYMLADALNDAGYSIPHVLKFFTVELDWSKDTVKEILWKETQQALLRKRSTTKLNKQKDIQVVYEHLNRSLGEKLHIHVPFPSLPPGEKDNALTHDEYNAKVHRS